MSLLDYDDRVVFQGLIFIRVTRPLLCSKTTTFRRKSPRINPWPGVIQRNRDPSRMSQSSTTVTPSGLSPTGLPVPDEIAELRGKQPRLVSTLRPSSENLIRRTACQRNTDLRIISLWAPFSISQRLTGPSSSAAAVVLPSGDMADAYGVEEEVQNLLVTVRLSIPEKQERRACPSLPS
jgi:hypothetical protein